MLSAAVDVFGGHGHGFGQSFTLNCHINDKKEAAHYNSLLCIPVSNKIYLVTLTYGQSTQALFLQKKSNVAKCFFDIFNTEIAQCRQQLDVILGTKVIQF